MPLNGPFFEIVAALLLPLLLGVTMTHAEDSSPLQLTVDTYQLANGLKVALREEPGAARTTIAVTYHVGSKNERVGLTGFAHFFEHMMFRGTRNVPDFDQPLQKAGGSPNAFTSQDVTLYFESVSNSYLERAIYMEAERMGFLSSALDQDKFDTEREVVKNERRQVMENRPYGLADETLSCHVFPKGHPYSWSVIGSMNDLNRSTLEDLRRFFHEFYHPANATLTLVGGFDSSAVKPWIETYFGSLNPGPTPAAFVVPPSAATPLRITQKDRVRFPRVYWTWPTVCETGADAAPLELLSRLLADGDASRLEQTLVKGAQVAVEVSAASDTNELAGRFEIAATVAPTKQIEDVEELIGHEIQKVRSMEPSAEELDRIKVKYRTQVLVSLASPAQRAFAISMGLAKYDDPHYSQKTLEDHQQVTPADIMRVAQKYLVPDKIVLVIEPVGEGQDESPAVLAGPIARDEAARTTNASSSPAGPDWTVMPGPSPPAKFAAPPFQRRKLTNGLEVWVAPWHTLPIVSTNLLVRAGASDDPDAKSGLATLLASLWDKGTQDLTATEFAETLDGLGTSLLVGAGTDTTQLSFTVESSNLPQAIELVGQMITEPRFDPVDFEQEKTLQQSDLASGPDRLPWIASRVFPTLLYGERHPFANRQLGFADTLDSLSLDDVQRFYDRKFVPQGSVLIIAGDVGVDQVISLLNSHWCSWSGKASKTKIARPKTTPHSKIVYLVDKPGAVQSVIVVGRLWRSRKDESYPAALLGNRVFGGDFLSRVNQNLRQRNGFTYGAQSSFRFRRIEGAWTLQTSVQTAVTGAALKEIMNELADVAGKRPLTDEEIDAARAAEINAFPRSFETPSSIAGTLAQAAIYRLPTDYFDEFIDQLNTTSSADAAKVMSELANQQDHKILIVGDRQAVIPALKESGFDQVQFVDIDGRTQNDPSDE